MLLAFDTATPAVTLALADGQTVLAERSTVDARRHGELLACGIESLLAEVGVGAGAITRIAVGVGPGPFTGLRVGLVTAAAWGHALGVEVIGVCSLDTLAHQSGLGGSFVVATDARRREVYWARYTGGVRVGPPQVDRPADVPASGPVVGPGARLYPEVFTEPAPPEQLRAAAMVAYLAAGGATRPPRPLYLRRPDAASPRAPKRVRA